VVYLPANNRLTLHLARRGRVIPPHRYQSAQRWRLIWPTRKHSTPGGPPPHHQSTIRAVFSLHYTNGLVGVSDTNGASATGNILYQRGRVFSRWGDDTRSELGSPAMQSPPPQPLSPTRSYSQGGDVSDVSATPPSSLGPPRHLGSLDRQRPVLTPLEPLPRRRPASTRTDLSPRPFSEASGTTGVQPPRNQQVTQTASVYLRSNQHTSRTHSSDHSLSRGLPALPSLRQRDKQVARQTPSIPTRPGRPSDREGLHPYLIAITARDSRLTQNRKSYLETHFQMTQFRPQNSIL
jgi:hypothetical protein